MKIFTIVISLLVFYVSPLLAAQINYDSYPSGFNGERTGTVWLNHEKYDVTERPTFGGQTEVEIKNFNNTFRGTVDSFGYGTLRDFNGNTVKIKPY